MVFGSASRRLLRWLAVFLVLLSTGCGRTDTYPDQPIRLICPWAVGGGTDRVARQLGLFLEEDLGVPVNVVNVTGGGGVTGHSHGASARPDGYTMTLVTVEINMLHWRQLTDLAYEDFEPVALVNVDPAALFVRADDERNWTNLKDLRDYVRDSPGELTASGTAPGGIWHLALAGWLASEGMDPEAIRWIPMNGAGPSLQELVSGGLDIVSCSLPEARTFLEGGQVRALGVMSDEPLESFPEVATLKSMGLNWSLGAWRGIAFPAGVPEERVRRVAASIEAIMKGEVLVNGRAFPELMLSQGFNAEWLGPVEFKQMLAENNRILGELLTRDEFISLREREPLRPMIFPIIILSGLALTLMILVARDRTQTSSAAPVAIERNWIHFVEGIMMIILFVAMVETVGFLLTGSLLLSALIWRLGGRPRVALTVAVIIVPVVYQVFAHWLKVPLPRGWLGW
ncbi:MAG TPA: tripartite tricarboxylate transporter substrate-binding protein [Acidobacteriota bacterium]|nr:tripartite tricarboxylate transporter substrate-binding protein [Acidobacteriota bacterium]